MKSRLEPSIYENIRTILTEARSKAYLVINKAMVEAYWNIGKIVCEAQGSNERAEYGDYLIQNLSEKLTLEFGKGFTPTNLKYMRQFYLTFPIGHALSDRLSWTHYRLLMKVEKDDVRQFYLEECVKNQWSTRQLERQISSLYYERILATQNQHKNEVRQEIQQLEPGVLPEDIIKDPYVLEFLGTKENIKYTEKELESGLIANLQEFLLELGRGFSFVARQKRITAEGEHFYIDLVFYNFFLKCFVLIDLKVGKLTHQDIGQMDFYVRFFEKEIKDVSDNPTIGLILCSEKNETIVKYSILEESRQIFASKYLLYLPTEEELKRELDRERQALALEQKIEEGQ
jgi:predicted nuclease of restriction endonuclease-like (RecB) superfamily